MHRRRIIFSNYKFHHQQFCYCSHELVTSPIVANYMYKMNKLLKLPLSPSILRIRMKIYINNNICYHRKPHCKIKFRTDSLKSFHHFQNFLIPELNVLKRTVPGMSNV